MSEKRNLRDHKRRLLATATKYELRRKLYKASFFYKEKIPIFVVRCGTNIVISCPSCQERVPLRKRNRCIFTGRPRGVDEFFRNSRIVFRGLASRGPGIKKSS